MGTRKRIRYRGRMRYVEFIDEPDVVEVTPEVTPEVAQDLEHEKPKRKRRKKED